MERHQTTNSDNNKQQDDPTMTTFKSDTSWIINRSGQSDESRDDDEVIKPPSLPETIRTTTSTANKGNANTITIARDEAAEVVRVSKLMNSVCIKVFETDQDLKIGESDIILFGSSSSAAGHDNLQQLSSIETVTATATNEDMIIQQTESREPPPPIPDPKANLSADSKVMVVDEPSGDAVETVKAPSFIEEHEEEHGDKHEEKHVECEGKEAIDTPTLTTTPTTTSPKSNYAVDSNSHQVIEDDEGGLEIVDKNRPPETTPPKTKSFWESLQKVLDGDTATVSESTKAATRETSSPTDDTRQSSAGKQEGSEPSVSTESVKAEGGTVDNPSSVSTALSLPRDVERQAHASKTTFVSSGLGIEVPKDEGKAKVKGNTASEAIHEFLADIRALLVETDTPLFSLNSYGEDDGEGISIDEKYFLSHKDSGSISHPSLGTDATSSAATPTRRARYVPGTVSTSFGTFEYGKDVSGEDDETFSDVDVDDESGSVEFFFLDNYNPPNRAQTNSGPSRVISQLITSSPIMEAPSQQVLVQEEEDGGLETRPVVFARKGSYRHNELCSLRAYGMERSRRQTPLTAYGTKSKSIATESSTGDTSSETGRRVAVRVDDIGALETSLVGNLACPTEDDPSVSPSNASLDADDTLENKRGIKSGRGRPPRPFWHNRLRRKYPSRAKLVNKRVEPREDQRNEDSAVKGSGSGSNTTGTATETRGSGETNEKTEPAPSPTKQVSTKPNAPKDVNQPANRPAEYSRNEASKQKPTVSPNPQTDANAFIGPSNKQQAAAPAAAVKVLVSPYKKQPSPIGTLVVRSFNNKHTSLSWSDGEEEFEERGFGLSESGLQYTMSDPLSENETGVSTLGTKGLNILKAVSSRTSKAARTQILDEVSLPPRRPAYHVLLESDSSSVFSIEGLKSTDAGVVPSVIACDEPLVTSVPSQCTTDNADIVPLDKDVRCRSEYVVPAKPQAAPAPRSRSDRVVRKRETKSPDADDDIYIHGCSLMRQISLGNVDKVRKIIKQHPKTVNFSDYDQRTPLHVAAAECNVKLCRLLISNGSPLNRSDRWGVSPLDDAQRLHHEPVLRILRAHQARTGSTDRVTNLLAACDEGDVVEVRRILDTSTAKLDIERKDFNGQTCMHLAASNGNLEIVKMLCKAGASVNSVNKWGRRPLDVCLDGGHTAVATFLKQKGAKLGEKQLPHLGSGAESLMSREQECILVGSECVELLDLIGSGTLGDVYKCKYQGGLAAAKLISAQRIRMEWTKQYTLSAMAKKKHLDDILEVLDEAESLLCDQDEQAVQDFRDEYTVTKSLEHPNIVRLLAYTVTKEYEVPIYELMHWSLDDLLQFHNKTGTKLEHEKQIQFAVEFAQGMCYLHSREPPAFHGDLKPSNLLIDASGTLKIADVGLAKIIPDVARGLQSNGNTAVHRFIAPELIRNEAFGPSADVYSFAMILYNLLDGRPPWPNMNGIKAATLAAERGERPELDEKWDPRLRYLISECWKGEPADRPNFEKILSNLTEYQDDFLSTRSSSSRQSSNSKRPRRFLRQTRSPHHQQSPGDHSLEASASVKKRIGSLLKRRSAVATSAQESCKSKNTAKTSPM